MNNNNNKNIAPTKKIIEDLNKFNPKLDFESDEIISSIIALSLLGHAKNGHNTYKGESYPQTTINDILSGLKAEDLRKISSNYIENTFNLFKELLDLVISNEKLESSYFYNYKKEGIDLSNTGTIFDSKLFKEQVIKNPDFFLKGAFIASKMDSLEMRIKTKERYRNNLTGGKYILGGGTCHIGNLENLRRLNIDIKGLEENEISKNKLEYLIKQNCIIINPELEFRNNSNNFNLINIYIRGKNGLGICDDAAILSSSLFIKKEFGFEKAKDFYIGAAIMDTIDTLDKVNLNLVTGGVDEYIGNYINNRYKQTTGQELAVDKEIFRTIYLGAKTNTFKLPFSSSVRYFNQEDIKSSNQNIITTHRTHLKFLKDEEIISGLYFGYQKMRSEDFYNIIKERIKLYGLKH